MSAEANRVFIAAWVRHTGPAVLRGMGVQQQRFDDVLQEVALRFLTRYGERPFEGEEATRLANTIARNLVREGCRRAADPAELPADELVADNRVSESEWIQASDDAKRIISEMIALFPGRPAEIVRLLIEEGDDVERTAILLLSREGVTEPTSDAVTQMAHYVRQSKSRFVREQVGAAIESGMAPKHWLPVVAAILAGSAGTATASGPTDAQGDIEFTAAVVGKRTRQFFTPLNRHFIPAFRKACEVYAGRCSQDKGHSAAKGSRRVPLNRVALCELVMSVISLWKDTGHPGDQLLYDVAYAGFDFVESRRAYHKLFPGVWPFTEDPPPPSYLQHQRDALSVKEQLLPVAVDYLLEYGIIKSGDLPSEPI